MVVNTKLHAHETRENRLGSITGYSGTLKDLHHKACCGTLQDKERCFSQASTCNAACAFSILSFIVDAAMIQHSPSGCAVTAMQVSNSKDQLAAKIGLNHSKSCYVCTDMDETDTIYGATENLKEVILETYRRYRPNAIFVGASCVSGVIGEDLESVRSEVSGIIPIPVALVYCEGFKTKIWASGFDAAFHAILTSIVKPPEKKSNIINIINFYGSARKEITEIFHEFGYEPLFLISNTTIEQLSRISESAATISTCGTLGSYLGNGLSDLYGVPYVVSLQPHGIEGFDCWLSELGKVLGKEEEIKAYLAREKEKYLPKIEEVKRKLKGLKAVVGMGPGFNFNTSRALQELGIEIVYSAAWHFDRQYDDGKIPSAFDHLAHNSPNDFPLNVCDLQNHEMIHILKSAKPDIFFSRHTGSTVWAMKLGIPALCLYDEYDIFGYKGLLNFAYSILDKVTNQSFTENLSRRVKLPYNDWWFSQNNNHFLKSGEDNGS